MDLLQYIGSIGGITGILAYFIFLWNKSLVKQMREDRKFMEDRLSGIIGDYNLTCRNNQQIMIEHTQVMTELITYLRLKNGSH